MVKHNTYSSYSVRGTTGETRRDTTDKDISIVGILDTSIPFEIERRFY